MFDPPTWPAALLVFNQVIEEDKSFHDLQVQWGMVSLPLTQAIDRLEACKGPVMISADPDQPESLLKEELDTLVATPLAHTLRSVDANFNEISTKCCRCLLKGICDLLLVRWLEDSKESVSSLFPGDVAAALEAVHAHRMDGLISMALQASRPSPSCTSSAKGKQYEPYSTSCQPFCGGCPRFGGQGRQLHHSNCGHSSSASALESSLSNQDSSV